MTKDELRAKMPLVTAFIDDLREVFGKDAIENQIRRGLHASCTGDCTFYASECGITMGKPAVYPVGAVFVTPLLCHPVVVGRAKA